MDIKILNELAEKMISEIPNLEGKKKGKSLKLILAYNKKFQEELKK